MKTRSSVTLRAALFVALVVGVTQALAAIPGQPDAAAVKTIEACLADATKAKTDPDVCIGRVWNDCLANAPTIPAKKECSDRELLVWSAALNRDYLQLTALLTDDILKQALRDAERDFIIAKSKKCTFERLAHKDSSASLMAASRCDVRDTARQDLWLRDQINSFKSP
jgi:uncharacterized protein YecT (DUF1311 family)